MPTFSPPTSPGVTFTNPDESETSRTRLFQHFQVPGGQTVWIDQSDQVHIEEYPYQDDLTNAKRVWEGGHLHQITDLDALLLLSLGLPVSGHYETEEQKWIDYALQAAPNLEWMSGDGFATQKLADNTGLAIFADNAVGTLDSDGYYDVVNVSRNALFVTDSSNNISGQVLINGNEHTPLRSLTPGNWYWPLDITLDGSGDGALTNIVIGALELAPGGIIGDLQSNVLLTLTGFGTISTRTPVTIWSDTYELHNIYNDTTHHYIIAHAINPSDPFSPFFIMARAPIGQLLTIASWENWTDSGWSSVGLPAPLKNNKGQVLTGSGVTITKTATKYVLAITSIREQAVDLYHATVPQGPYTYYHTSSHPNPPKGLASDPKTKGARPKGQYFAYYQPKFHEHLSPSPTLNLILSYNRNVFSEGFPYLSAAPVSNEYHVSTGCPQFVFVPTPEAIV